VLLLGSLKETALLDLEKPEMQSFPLEATVSPVELSINSAISLLLNLGGRITRKEHVVFR
jgi:hypothetical protein